MEIFSQLLNESEFLSEETKVALTDKMTQIINEEKELARAEVTADLNKQWITERERLISSIDIQVHAIANAEFKDLREDIEAFRDLEAEMATKLVENTNKMEDELRIHYNRDRKQLIEALDIFLTESVERNFAELKDQLNEVRKNQMGRRIMEAFYQEFREFYTTPDSLEGQLEEAKARINDLSQKLVESEDQVVKVQRDSILSGLLLPLDGNTRTVMETILQPVATEQLESMYKRMLPRVLESANISEKEKTVLAESNKGQPKGRQINGDSAPTIIQEQLNRQAKAAQQAAIKQLDESDQSTLNAWLKISGVNTY